MSRRSKKKKKNRKKRKERQAKESNERAWYKLVFLQKQPIHVGSSRWGVINETGVFISGQTMWGALVNAYIHQKKCFDEEKIKKIQEKFKTITNFFPCFDESGSEVLFPEYKKGTLYLGDMPEEKFRYAFIDTIVKTSIEPICRKAKDESLHEFDFILPRNKDTGKNQNIHWVGLLYCDEDVKNFLEEKKLTLFVGGDTRYGFGEITLNKISKAFEEDPQHLQLQWNINIQEGAKPILENNTRLSNFLQLDSNIESIKFQGETELIVEMDFRQNSPKVTNHKLFITPGSKIIEITIKDGNECKIEKGKIILN